MHVQKIKAKIDQIEKFRTAVLVSALSTAVGIIGFLCLMDLPWKWIVRKWSSLKSFLKKQTNKTSGDSSNTSQQIKNSNAVSDDAMLNRFKIALIQNKRNNLHAINSKVLRKIEEDTSQ